MAQHGGPSGWLEESDPAGVILYVMDGPYRLPFLYPTMQLPCQQLPGCELIEFQMRGIDTFISYKFIQTQFTYRNSLTRRIFL
jgi:hypothetical protein